MSEAEQVQQEEPQQQELRQLKPQQESQQQEELKQDQKKEEDEKQKQRQAELKKLFLCGLRDGGIGSSFARVLLTIRSNCVIRTAIAWCMFWSGLAFFVTMVLADFFGASGDTMVQSLFLFFPLTTFIQFLCSPQHKEILIQIGKSGNNSARAKSAAGGDSMDILALLNSLQRSLSEYLYTMLFHYVLLVEISVVSLLPFPFGYLARVLLNAYVQVYECLLYKYPSTWKRMHKLEEFRSRWVYYFGLGLPFSLVCNSFSRTTSIFLSCMFFPVFEILVLLANDTREMKGLFRETPDETPETAGKSVHRKPLVTVFLAAEFIVDQLMYYIDMLMSRLGQQQESAAPAAAAAAAEEHPKSA